MHGHAKYELRPQVDLLQNKSVDELCEKLSGKIDVLVNNAGMVDTGSVLEGAHSRAEPLPQLHPAHICMPRCCSPRCAGSEEGTHAQPLQVMQTSGTS